MSNKFRRVVIKIGSSSLTHENGKINLRRLDQFVRVVADLRNRGIEVVLVSSGAISVGVAKMGLAKRPSAMPLKQAAASVGQVELMFLYDKLFGEYNQSVSQILLTRDVVDDEVRHKNVVNTFNTLFDYNCLPIVNENDTVSVEEIDFSDNDTLSAIVAVLTEADLLVLMSDIDGLYDSNPRENPDAKLISRIEKIDERVHALAGGAGTSHGTGGMVTKITAAEYAMAHGIPMLIVNADRPENLYDIFDGKRVGTLFTTKHRED